ncbi:MAG TPA: head maturation protease, ClpP-related [Terriglobales bacterium]|nr:head maturation protease, ClpP-related [Terriglobales bacterium]
MKNPLHQFISARQADTLTLYCYDSVGETMFGSGITASAVAAKLDDKTFKAIHLHINSPGGDPFEATAILNLLKGTGKPINVTVDGLAASAASILAMAGDTIEMGEGSMFMIHAASSIALGNAGELRKLADTLDKVSNTMAETYAARTGLPVAEITALMNAETWMDAKEAVAKGFADSIVPADPRAAAVSASFDLSGFRNTPATLKDARAEYTDAELLRMRLQLG